MKKHCIVCTLLLLRGIALAFVQYAQQHFLPHIQSKSMIILNSLGFDIRFRGLEKEDKLKRIVYIESY